MQPMPSPFHGACGLLLFIFLLPHALFVQTAQAQTQPPAAYPAAVPAVVPPAALPANSAISITVSQSVIQPVGGKLPPSINFTVFETDCDDAKGISLVDYTFTITNAGISPTGLKAGRCAITATLTIDPNAPPGKRFVNLLDSTGAPVASADFTVMDTTAGPIPPGLEPEVDVLWEVMSQKNCADVFGTRVAASIYCIQLKIGNNAGHPIQVAGIGFKNQHTDLAALGVPFVTFANSSYAATRAILLHQEMWNPRNVFYHSLEGAGLIMAGFTPFFRRPNPRGNFATLASIVSGPMLQAFDIISPDPIISQLNNLDDQSFRDNLVIPNNAFGLLTIAGVTEIVYRRTSSDSSYLRNS
jgi:hypothetical protein